MKLKRLQTNGHNSIAKRLKTNEPKCEEIFTNTDNSSECSSDSLASCSELVTKGIFLKTNVELTKCLALDCEMVGVGHCYSNALARCSLVNYNGEVVVDVYVKPGQPVTDYRTKWSGIRREDLKDGHCFDDVRKFVRKIIEGCILVGHALHSDLLALKLTHPRHLVRDTSKYCPIRGLAGLKQNMTPSLRDLAGILLNETIQDGEHCSVEDARATMSLYRLCESQWEKELRGELSNESYLSDMYWPSWTRNRHQT
ncbi:apoptosis-enhancing nuclease-like [Xenia sp. Carnegie-2017]|uniref:apoptosis-enhancing nuclease-like n=1 Tax=Xenia sp. Carnegie-2017 TaxID=2897299 RepID=UPI001F04EDC5|nr:apoptosis-enhancing nuclease-like [Xenia sp. Carnegie-2017]